MLEVFQALAHRLNWVRLPAITLAVGCAALFAYAALSANAPESYFTAGLAGLAWALLLFAFIAIFQHVPPLPTQEQSRWQRIVVRVRRFGYGLLALATAGTTVALIMLSIRVA